MASSDGQTRRPRVLLLAYACSPERGSEPGLGWHRAVETAKSCDTWVICEDCTYGAAIRRYLREHGDIPGLHFEYVAMTSPIRWLGRIPGLAYTAYNLWHRRAYRVARRLHQQVRFDLVHQVNFCGYREPGYLWRLDAPFVWGPVGGTQNYPWRFLAQADLRGALGEALRSVMNSLQLRFSPRVRRAARKAAVLLVANSTNQRDFRRVHGITPALMLETGLPQVAGRLRTSSAGRLRLLWSGDLSPWKALPLLLQALARLPADISWELRVLGQGRLKDRWQRLAQRLGVAPHVTWMGWRPHPEALRQYDWADVFVFTSLRDTSGNVVLEALAAGLPVICLDHQGVHDIVTDTCGIKVPVTTPREVIGGLREALVTLALNPGKRELLGQGALARAREYLWSRQGERMAAVYRRVLNGAVGQDSNPDKALSGLES